MLRLAGSPHTRIPFSIRRFASLRIPEVSSPHNLGAATLSSSPIHHLRFILFSPTNQEPQIIDLESKMNGLRPGWAVKAIVVVIFTSMLFRCVSAAAAAPATNHSVGGASGWDLSSNLQAWVTRVTFHVGDSLVFRYTPVHDLLEVNKMEYDLCHTVDPIETHSDGETVIPLVQAGHRYFMCGRAGHCAMGLKLHVHVIPAALTASPTPPNTTTSSGNATSSSPEASPITSPAPDQALGNLVPASPPMQPAVSANTPVNSSAAPGRGGNATTSDANNNLNVDRTWLALLILVVLTMQSWSPLFSTISLLLVFLYNWVHMRRQ